jgi:hypothetical protein
MKNKKYTWWMIRNDKLQSLYEPWPTHKDYCPKCHERQLNEIRRYPIRRNHATGKMLYDYSHGRLRWPQKVKKGEKDD